MPSLEQLFWVGVLILAALIPVARQYWKSRHKRPPYCARHDKKAYRLWQTDPQAYARKYADLDLQLEAKEQAKAHANEAAKKRSQDD